MKRVITGSLLFVGAVVVAIYIFIPSTLTLSKTEIVPLPEETVLRLMKDNQNWQRWTKGHDDTIVQQDSKNKFFVRGRDTVQLGDVVQNGVQVTLRNGPIYTSGAITILPLSIDSAALQWETTIASGNDPFTKIQRYKQAIQTKKNMTAILQRVKEFAQQPEHVYGHKFSVGSTIDTLLVAIRTTQTSYPNTEAIYALVKRLQHYISQQGARQTAYPMTNITRVTDGEYHLMVAVPTNKLLPPKGDIMQRKLVPGKYIVANVNGGPVTIEHAFAMMQLYMTENKKVEIAIPFQTLITDRTRETDTTKWVTKINYPIL